MYFRIIRNDILQGKVVTFTTILFVSIASMLVSLAAILVVNLTGSIDSLMTKAKTPHFMQMHSGSLDKDRLKTFAEKNDNVEEYQVVEFVGMDGAHIILGDKTLGNSIQDNGFSTQNEKFDFLLDLNGNIINVSDGEVYVPVTYMKDNTTKIGDKVVVSGKELIVAGFLRDSMMNSSLSTSKRFLVSDNDYAEIKDLGSIEYLIEFRLKDFSAIGEFETAYASASLESNGPAVTYTLFKTMNAISDGIMIAVILLVSALVVAITLICIRFTLLAKIEDDYREIGVMKAIGLRITDIKKIYLAKYAAIAAIGSIIGFTLSAMFQGLLLKNIRLYMGESTNSIYANTLGLVGILLVFLAIIVYVNNVLKRFRKIPASEAIRFGTSQDKKARAIHLTLAKNRLLSMNIFLGIKDVLSRKRLYATMLVVLVISAFIIIVPQNLNNTISSRSFIQHMGIGNYDLRIQYNSDDKNSEIVKKIENDSTVAKYAVLTTKTFKVKTSNGTEENIKVELGDHSIFPIDYFKGRAPIEKNEIALSTIYADELSKKVNDVISLVIDGKIKTLTVTGIYSDVTNGGKTAKAVFADLSANVMWTIICVALSDKSLIYNSILNYSADFPFAKISDIGEFVSQTLGSTIKSIEMVSYVSFAIALIITSLVTILFIKMLVAKDRYSIAVLKALGFTNSDVRVQFISRALFVLIVGIVIGTLLANTFGESLAVAVVSTFGASTFKFEVNSLTAFVFIPLLMIYTVLISAMIGTTGIKQIKISENIKE